MARLAQLKLSMTIAIFLASFVFVVFLGIITAIFQLSLIWAFAATLLFLLFQYLVGPVIVKGTTHLRYLKADEDSWLRSTVEALAGKSGLRPPRLAVVPDQSPNAFIFGRTSGDATLAVHEGLLKQLNKEEIKAVIGHELGHLKHKDFLVMTMLSSLPLIAYWISWGTFEAAKWSRSSSSSSKKEGGFRAPLFVVAAVAYVVYIVMLLCVKGLSRLREHYADAYSAFLTDQPRQLQSALAKITYGLSLSPRPTTGARTLYIGDPAMAKEECQSIINQKDVYDLDKDGVLDERELQLAMEREAKSTWTTINKWFSTHPPTFKRILLLREIEDEMASGRYISSRIYTHI